MDAESGNPNSSRRTSAGSETAEAAKMELKNATADKKPSGKAGDEQQSNSNQEDNDDDDKEGDDDDDDDKEKVIEKSHNDRFLKKNAQILSYKVPGVNAYVSFEIKTGKEVIWNDVICESSETKEARLLTQLKKIRRSYHPNSLRILDCWRNENRISFITERPDETYTTLRHWFNISRLSRNAMTSKRLIRQVVSGLKYFSEHSLVHGNISTDSILIYGTNIKLGPFALDAFWHSHTVRKTTKKNFYLSSDWSDPAARITSLTDAYAMGVLCLEIVLWCPLDNELGEGDVDVPKYVLDKVEQFDDPLLRNFIKVCMAGNRHLGINELFDVSAFFEPPSLRHLAAKVITDAVITHFSNQIPPPASTTGATTSAASKQTADINGAYQQLLRHARSSFEVDSIVAQVNLKDGSTRQLLFKDVAQYYISFKFLEDIDHGYYPLIKFDQNGKAIVPAHVRRIISGDWQKEKEEKEAKEKEKAGQSSLGQSSTTTIMSDFTGGGASIDTKSRNKESKDAAAGGAGGAGAESSGAGRPASAEKVSPPRGGASATSGTSSGGGAGGSTPANMSRQATASPARQQPSKLPVIDSSGVRRSTSVSALAAGSGKAAGGAAEAPKDGAKDGGGTTGNAAATTASSGGGGGSHCATATAGGVSTVSSQTSSSGGRAHAGSGAGGAAKEGKRLTTTRITIASGSGSSGSGGGSSAAGQGASGVSSGSSATGGAIGNSATAHGHGGARRTGGKAARGASRSGGGGSVGLLRRRGGSTSPMPQRVRHGVESSGRMARGGSTSLASHGRQATAKNATAAAAAADSAASSGGQVASEEHGRAHGPRVRRVFNEGTTREHHRRTSHSFSDTRTSTEPEKLAAESMTGSTVTTTGVIDEPSPAKETGGASQLSSENPEVAHSSDEEEYEEDYEDYYEDDLEELYEEDEIEYESQFEHRGRRGQEDHVVNIITDVAPPAENERGSAYFTDVFFEYLGLGRWLLVVKFHLLRCREDPRGNPYRELMMQLKDNEWHDVDALLDRLTHSGILMRPEERPILRQYLDAARHNRPLRETYVQNGLAGPDPEELFERLLNVQKERQSARQDTAGLEYQQQDAAATEAAAMAAMLAAPPGREEKAASQEPPGGLPSDPSGQSSRHTEAWSHPHLRSEMETPGGSEGVPSDQPQHSASCLHRAHMPSMQKEVSRDSKPHLTSRLEHGEAASIKEAPPAGAPEGEVEGEDEGSGKRTFACSCMPGTHAQNPLEPLNKYCPFCDRCDYLLVDGPAYLRSPCYHCRVNNAEKEGLSGEQLYRLHTQNRVPWPLFLQKYFNWPPDDPVSDAMALNECKWRSRVVCVCFHDQATWPPCVEFPWLYNPPQGSIAYRMQVEQFSPSTHLEPMNLWCRRQSQRTDILKNISSIASMFRTGEKFPGTAVVNGAAATTAAKRQRAERDPELMARPPRRARSLTVGSEHSHWSQLFSMSIAMHHPPGGPTASAKNDGNVSESTMTVNPAAPRVNRSEVDSMKIEVPLPTAPSSMMASAAKLPKSDRAMGTTETESMSSLVSGLTSISTTEDSSFMMPEEKPRGVKREDSDQQQQQQKQQPQTQKRVQSSDGNSTSQKQTSQTLETSPAQSTHD